MLCTTLTVIVLGLLAIVCFGLEYFIPEGQDDRFSERWMRGTTIALLVVSVSPLRFDFFLFVSFNKISNNGHQLCAIRNFVIFKLS